LENGHSERGRLENGWCAIVPIICLKYILVSGRQKYKDMKSVCVFLIQ
jgi:hypothetical protein